MVGKIKKKYIVLGGIFSLIAFTFALEHYQKEYEKKRRIEIKKTVKSEIGDHFGPGKLKLPHDIKFEDDLFEVEYTFNDELTSYVRKLLRRHRPDYTSVVIIDNNNGNILTAIGHQREGNKPADVLPFTSTHPSASLFKVITSAALVEDADVKNKTVFTYRGRGTTLYKYQLKNKKTRWTRKQSFKNAFAFSNNVVFGKAAINHISGEELFDMARKFGFNEELMVDVDLSKSRFVHPRSDYHLAELASGFNKETLISPIHGALIASVVANDGELVYPRMVLNVKNKSTKELIWNNEVRSKKVYSKETADYLESLMEYTANKGTARILERKLPRKMRRDLIVGAKTGSLTGGIPYGKRDWVTTFAKPASSAEKDKGISICVMIVNKKKWYVKSTFLANKIINYYYKKIDPVNGDALLTSR